MAEADVGANSSVYTLTTQSHDETLLILCVTVCMVSLLSCTVATYAVQVHYITYFPQVKILHVQV